MSKSWLWVFGVWLISILIGGLWGLLSIQSFNTTLITQWLDKHSGSVQAVSAGLIVLLLILALVLLVIAYAIFSKKLRRASDAFASIAQDQAKFLRATQRAYISVEPDGILMVVGGAGVLGHVGVHNTGHLPAHNVRWFLDMKASPDRAEKEFAIGAFHGDAVVPPGVIMPRATSTKMLVAELNAQSGNPIRVRSEESPVFLYVWGMVAYQDGLGKDRWTRFCHRYNWVMRGDGEIGKYDVERKYARYHEYGNATDQSPPLG